MRGLENERIAAIRAHRRRRSAGRREQPTAVGRVAEECREDRVGIETRQAEPIDRPAPTDERGGAAIADQRVVFDQQWVTSPR
jgi:hypothetical protein